MQCICEAKFTLEKVIFRMDLMLQVKNPFKECKGLPKKMPFGKKITKMQKNLVKLSYFAQKVQLRGRVPVLYLVDLPSILTQNNGRKRPIFVTPCILPTHTGFKNIFSKKSLI
jgi:hypothetical protein